MGPNGNIRFGGGDTASNVDPLVMVIMAIAILLICLLPRKYVVVPFLLAMFLTPFGQQFYVAGLHVFISRILILCGWIRIIWTKSSSRSEIASGGFTPIDSIFTFMVFISVLATCILFQQMAAVVNQFGYIWDAMGGFFLLRFLIRDEEDAARVIKTFAFVAFVLAITMTGEKLFNRNIFGYIGGRLVPFVRDGAIRAQATFEGPIPAGTFGATLLCFLVWLWHGGKSRAIAIAGFVGSAVMVVTSASSTPLLAYAGGILAIICWPLRRNMRIIRWGIVMLLISLHLVMKAPVWFLIDHVDLVAGNSGYHRAMLIDGLVKHFSDWWLIGVKSTANWGWDMWDQANAFVAAGENGGLATLICFILLISRGFGRLGEARKIIDGDRKHEWMLWALGCALFSHVVSFFGIGFNDQAVFAWYALIAIICVTTSPILARNVELPEPQSNLALVHQPLGYSSGSVELQPEVAYLNGKQWQQH